MRRRGRVCALQILYQLDIRGMLGSRGTDAAGLREVIGRFWQCFEPVAPPDEAFAERLVMGVTRDVEALDAALAAASHHWKVERMDRVDRSALRLAAYEIMHCPDIPRSASINEAIELVKRFSHTGAAAFINGILDQLATRHEALGDGGTGERVATIVAG